MYHDDVKGSVRWEDEKIYYERMKVKKGIGDLHSQTSRPEFGEGIVRKWSH